MNIKMTAMAVMMVTVIFFCSTHAHSIEYNGTRFQEVWNQVASDPYATLPQEEVTFANFFSEGTNMLMAAAKRTIEDQGDLLPEFTKLLHPNGICLKGTWNITEETPYTGYFRKGSVGLMIARASVALTETTKGSYRGFGFAGKIYPTTSANQGEVLKTANFFAIDDLAGTLTPNYTLAAMTNEPATSIRFNDLFLLRVGLNAAKALGAADQEVGRRQLYPIAELGMRDTFNSRSPTWMKVQGRKGLYVNQADFRKELLVQYYPESKILFDLFVADKVLRNGEKNWSKIGYMEFDESVASRSCDHRLHFSHPRFRINLR